MLSYMTTQPGHCMGTVELKVEQPAHLQDVAPCGKSYGCQDIHIHIVDIIIIISNKFTIRREASEHMKMCVQAIIVRQNSLS